MTNIIGVDEVGMGCNAGEVVICALKADISWEIEGLNDSKRLTPQVRAILYEQLKKDSKIQFVITSRTNAEIDERGLAACHKEAVGEAIDRLHTGTENVIVDGNLNPLSFQAKGMKTDPVFVRTVIKADGKYPAVMAASIIAKEYRDSLMKEYHKEFPHYGWEENSGYPVPAHKEAIKKYGLCRLHRKTYKIKL